MNVKYMLPSFLLAGVCACGAKPAPQVVLATAAPPPAIEEPGETVQNDHTPSSSSSADPSASDTVSETPPSEALPPAVELGAPVACTLGSSDFRPNDDVITFHLRPHALPFLRVLGGNADVLFPTGAPSTLLVQKQSGGLSIRGHVEPSGIPLYAARPVIMNGFVVPYPWARLQHVDAAPGEFTLSIATPSEISVTAKAPLSAKRPCSDASLDRGRVGASYDAGESVPGTQGKTKKTMFLKAGHSISLWTEPRVESAPAAQLKVGKNAPYVHVFETKPGLSRIVWPLDDMVAFGWVKTTELEASKPSSGYGSGSGRPSLRVPKWPLVARVVCSKDIPVIAESGNIRAAAGTIAQGTPIEIIEQMQGVSRIWVRVPHVFPIESTSPLLALQSDLKDCSDAPEAPGPRPLK